MAAAVAVAGAAFHSQADRPEIVRPQELSMFDRHKSGWD